MDTPKRPGRPRSGEFTRHPFHRLFERHLHGRTLAQVAAALGVSLRTVQGWSSGRKAPSTPLLILDKMDSTK